MSFDFPAFLVLATALTGGIWLFDALFLAPKRRRALEAADRPGTSDAATLYREPVVVEYARSFFPVILAVLVLRSFLVEPFRIPSNSMMPTLLTGDFILVNKFDYGLRWPVLNTKFLSIGEPQRGDVVVFKFPGDNKTDFIKRVVGVPGDVIRYCDKTVYINDKPQGQTPRGIYTGVGSGAVMTGAREALEDLNGVQHRILLRQGERGPTFGCQGPSEPPITVPPGSYFVMGDNRDNSNDSRYWGFVPEGNLIGKAFAIWFHWDGERPGMQKIAWERIGNAVH